MAYPEKTTFTRRDSLLVVLQGVVATALTRPVLGEAATAAPTPAPDYTPENDYPFFGGELPDGYRSVPGRARGSQSHETAEMARESTE